MQPVRLGTTCPACTVQSSSNQSLVTVRQLTTRTKEAHTLNMKSDNPTPTTKTTFKDQGVWHEQPVDKTKERNVMDKLIARANQSGLGEFTYTLTVRGTRHDAIIKLNGKFFAVVEIKNRLKPIWERKEYIVDVAKVDYLLGAAAFHGCKALLIAQDATGDTRYLDLTEVQKKGNRQPNGDLFASRMHKRADRDEWADLVATIPVPLFKAF